MKRNYLRTVPDKLAYRGWQIKVVGRGEKFCFACYPPGASSFCDDSCVYPSFKAALRAARHFVDWENAIQALTSVLGECLQSGKVSDEEYWNLTNFA